MATTADDPIAIFGIGVETGEIARVLGALQRAVVEHPVAAQTIASSLIAEGRRFCETAEGKAWLDQISTSELARQGRVLWEASILSMLDERAEPPLPSALVDAVLGALMEDDIEALVLGTNPLVGGEDD